MSSLTQEQQRLAALTKATPEAIERQQRRVALHMRSVAYLQRAVQVEKEAGKAALDEETAALLEDFRLYSV